MSANAELLAAALLRLITSPTGYSVVDKIDEERASWSGETAGEIRLTVDACVVISAEEADAIEKRLDGGGRR